MARSAVISSRAVRRSDRGQSLVETALALPVLCVTLIGALEGVRLLVAAMVLSSAAAAGAGYGAQSATQAADAAGIAAAVQQERTDAGQPGTASVTSSASTDPDGETVVTVVATYTWTTLLTYPGLPRTVAITRTAALQVRR